MSDLPAPFTPAACDLTDFAFMPLDVARLRDSELASSEAPEACWAAVLVWCASWHQIPAASIPDDDMWIAKQAGYQIRGKIDRAWNGVRAGARRGWTKCSDGRLYHAVVAEKANEAWRAKLKQRWMTECSRVKKHNQRHKTNHAVPEFDVWLSLGCPWGQPLSVSEDMPPNYGDNPGDTASKGQGERQGQGQGQDIHPSGCTHARASEAATALRAAGIADASPSDPRLTELLAAGMAIDEMLSAIPVDPAKRTIAYVLTRAKNRRVDASGLAELPAAAPPHPDSQPAVEAEAKAKGLPPYDELRPFPEWRAFVRAAPHPERITA